MAKAMVPVDELAVLAESPPEGGSSRLEEGLRLVRELGRARGVRLLPEEPENEQGGGR